MIKQFEINNHTAKQLQNHLAERGLTLAAAMADETENKARAAVLHAGFPILVRKMYSLEKFAAFFWEKREFLESHIQSRIDAAIKAAEKAAAKKQK